MSVENFLQKQVRLPTAPIIAARILDAVKEDGESYDSLGRVIATDPALTAKLLSVANSSLYAMPQKVTRIEQAIGLLGLNSVKNIALSFVVVRGLGTPHNGSFDFQVFLKRAVTGAVAAELLGNRMGLSRDNFFAGALLRDVGMLLFAIAVPEEYTLVFDEEQSSDKTLSRIEKVHFGCDHQELGAEILRRWGLPDSLSMPILHHHHPETAPAPYDTAARILFLADRMAALYHGFHSAERSREVKAMLINQYGQSNDTADELIDLVASRTDEMLAAYEVKSEAIKPYSQLLQEANDELGRLNLTYEQLVMELKQSKAKTEKLAAKLREANDRLRELAARDGLTGMYNHRHFQEILGQELASAKRYKRPLSLILFDIDFFKKVNDEYGHPAGDAVLKCLAAFVLKSIRVSDVAARYGGEEFAVILPETNARDAAIIAERLRRGIAALEIQAGPDQPLRITVSLGLRTSANDTPETTQQEIIDQADKALYSAKHSGRNRTVVARQQAQQ